MMRLLSWIFIFPVKIYQWTISPLLPRNICRYEPSCSNYFIQAVKVHGPFKGPFLGIMRLLRCAPWGGYGLDPVPPRKKKEAPEPPSS